jgi:predicted Zn-dependent peptidase
MKKPDRSKFPESKTITEAPLPKANKTHLSNNIPVFEIEKGNEDVIKIDFLFRAGNWFQPKPLVASATNEMLNEGTLNYTSEEIAEVMDYYGAFFKTGANKDTARISMLCLNKNLEKLLPVLSEIVKYPTFPEKEYKIYIENKKQQFKLDRSRVINLSRIHFNEALFGKEHPYGKVLNYEDHEYLNPEDLRNFHGNYYTAENCNIIVSGKIKNETHKLLEKFFGNGWQSNQAKKIPEFTPEPTDKKEIFTPKKEAVQSAIRIGKRLFNQHHPDFAGMNVLTTILGGYFGSRLMKNLREDKGYTYGVNAILISLVNEGYLLIVSEVGSKVCRASIEAIYEEIKRLKTEKVPGNELQMVKNYMMGDMLKSFDGLLPLSSTYINLVEHKLDESYFQNMIETINNIKQDDLLEIANKYLNEDELIHSIAGTCE